MTPGAGSSASALSLQRLPPAALSTQDAPIGGLLWGTGSARADLIGDSGTRVLSADGPRVDAWFSAGTLQQGRRGRVRWTHNGQWLHGVLDIDEAGEDASIEMLAYRAYQDVFATLAETGCRHLLRVWNYLPAINADADGMERYRQFNSGRQQAFLEAGQAAFEGAPAACALGTRDGPLRIRFLAGRRAALPVENPRQTSAYHYPAEYGPRSPTFSRAALLDCGAGQIALLISGTASIVGHETRHEGDVRAQTRETLTNLQAVIAAAHERCSARFDLATALCTIYVRHVPDVDAIRAVFHQAVGADSSAARQALFVEADVCRADLSVEIEAQLFAPGAITP
jgi:enamine deaminase RidA (YjgF/YER057c/UK114 family)